MGAVSGMLFTRGLQTQVRKLAAGIPTLAHAREIHGAAEPGIAK